MKNRMQNSIDIAYKEKSKDLPALCIYKNKKNIIILQIYFTKFQIKILKTKI